MSSMFRKPKKIQRRMFCADDEEDGDPEPPPPPLISQKREKKENSSAKAPKLLSFADEEEDCEEFKVKKSSQSKRLSKRREKEKKQVPDGDDNKYDNDNNIHEDNNANHTDTNQEKEKPKPKPKKKVTLEGLILSGREALAADGAGDISESGGEEEDEEDSRGFHQYRAESVRAALAVAPGHIPDAALIHAARKTRQQARELGDFVPVPSEAPPGARLVREGEGDDSADEEDGRIHVRGLDLPSDKPKRGTAAIQSDEEINSEAEEWEEQQMQKAMPALPDITGEGIELNPFAVAPPPPRLVDVPAHLRPLAAASDGPPASAAQLVEALRKRLSELQAGRARSAEQAAALAARLARAARVREARAARCAALDAAYKRAQAARGYLTDLVECLDEKMPMLEALESRALALYRRRCEFLVERRRDDLRDQAQDVLALAARPGASRGPDSEAKVRRTAEREGRRRARRLRREAGGARHHRDGDSSDDDLPPAELQHFLNERESIRSAAAALFRDALPAWRGVRGVCARLGAWRRRARAAYADAHAPAALPRLLAPYVRHQLILWNPLADEDNEDYEKMDWYKCLMMYGVTSERVEGESSDSEADSDSESGTPPSVSESSVREDPDLMLLPTMLNKVVLPKITELVEAAWDPMCVRACVRLRHAAVRAAAVPHAAPALRRLAAAARARLRAALNADVFLPALPPQVMDGAGGAFWRRCAGSGVRLLRGALALTAPPPLLHADPIVRQLIETLSCAAGAAPGPYIAAAALALAETLPRTGELRALALRRLAALASLALTRLETDNPMHLKALEQARLVIAEAKAME